jgi:hypothetical protein
MAWEGPQVLWALTHLEFQLCVLHDPSHTEPLKKAFHWC